VNDEILIDLGEVSEETKGCSPNGFESLQEPDEKCP
jgi:hypothetical protein